MSEEPQVKPEKFVWPAVVAFLGCIAAVVAILLFVPAENTGGQQAVVAILGMLGSAITSLFVWVKVGTVHRDVAEVKSRVNGRMTELIQAKTLPADEGQR